LIRISEPVVWVLTCVLARRWCQRRILMFSLVSIMHSRKVQHEGFMDCSSICLIVYDAIIRSGLIACAPHPG